MQKFKNIKLSKGQIGALVIFLCGLMAVIQAQSNPEATSLSVCAEALSSVADYVTAQSELATASLNANGITEAEYDQIILELQDAETSISMEQCMTAQGDDVELYHCITTNKGDYSLCR